MAPNHQKNIVITGATDGIGKAAALRLAQQGNNLLLVGRNEQKCKALVTEMVKETDNPNIHSLVADFSRIYSIRQVAGQIREHFDRLDVLVHSAGGGFPKKREVTSDGLEYTFVLLYLARFFLTEKLVSSLLRAPDSRVVSLAGGGTSNGLDINDLQSKKGYGLFAAIKKASATNDLLTLEQISRHPGIRFYNYGPGLVRTKTLMHDPVTRLVFGTVGRFFSRTPKQAGDDVVRLVLEDFSSGFYGARLKINTPTWARANGSLGVKLWDLSKTLVECV